MLFLVLAIYLNRKTISGGPIVFLARVQESLVGRLAANGLTAISAREKKKETGRWARPVSGPSGRTVTGQSRPSAKEAMDGAWPVF